MSIGIFARLNSNRPGAEFCGRSRAVRSTTQPPVAFAATLRAGSSGAKAGRLLHAKMINETHGAAIISLAGAAIALGINLAKLVCS